LHLGKAWLQEWAADIFLAEKTAPNSKEKLE